MKRWIHLKSIQARGKVRRFLLVKFRKDYVAGQINARQGECKQCGNCCEILFRCPLLIRGEDGTTWCSIYDNRPGQCAAFPVDRQCLAEVEFDCSYSFGAAGAIAPTAVLHQIEPSGT